MNRYIVGFLLGLLLCSCNSKTKDEEIVLGYKGKARGNPYLLAQQYVEVKGYEIIDQRGALHLGDEDAVVILPASAVQNVGDAKKLLDWVSWGGHAIVLLERGEDYWSDIGSYANHKFDGWTSFETEEVHSLGLDYLAEELYVDLFHNVSDEIVSDDEEKLDEKGNPVDSEEYYKLIQRGVVLPYVDDIQFTLDEVSLNASLGGNYTFQSQYDLEEGEFGNEADDEALKLLSVHYSDGRVTLLSDARLFRNPYLMMNDHAELLKTLVEQTSRDGAVIFNHGLVENFFTLMIREFSVVVWALLGIVLLWVWKNLPRFGPRQDVLIEDERDQLEYLMTTGNFLWSKGQDEALTHPLREEVCRRMKINHSELTAEQMQKISDSTGLSEIDVREAMKTEQIKDSNVLIRVVRHLQQILKSI